jgi:hypothetical protein
MSLSLKWMAKMGEAQYRNVEAGRIPALLCVVCGEELESLKVLCSLKLDHHARKKWC